MVIAFISGNHFATKMPHYLISCKSIAFKD